MQRDIVLCHPVRTTIDGFNGALWWQGVALALEAILD